MTYQEYRENRQKKANELPIFFAFSNQQFAEEMKKRGLTEKDTDKLYRFPGVSGGFYLKSDAPIIRAYFEEPDPLDKLMEDFEFAESAFYYEMGNHEYHINLYQGDWDVCSVFGKCEFSDTKTYIDYLSEIGYSENTIAAFKAARVRFLKDCDENDWY